MSRWNLFSRRCLTFEVLFEFSRLGFRFVPWNLLERKSLPVTLMFLSILLPFSVVACFLAGCAEPSHLCHQFVPSHITVVIVTSEPRVCLR